MLITYEVISAVNFHTNTSHILTGTPSNGRAALNGEMVSTHRDTFKGEALPTSTAASESVRRQRQRITCIPQGTLALWATLYMCFASQLYSG